MCSSVLGLAFLSRWALVLSCVTWLLTLSSRENFGAVTCYSVPDLTSLPRWAPTLSRGLGLTSLSGELRCCHVSHGLQRAVCYMNKERSSCLRHVAGLAYVQSTITCYRDSCKACGQAVTVRFNNATQAQLITPAYGYSGDTI
jgi:hypothetical protein